MKASKDAIIFIDLGFLSSEEEAIIQEVLLRDEDLKEHEIRRVRKLRESVVDPKQVKVFSGEWFEDLKSKRYGHQPHVTAVVRSSIRWKKSAGSRTNPFLKAMTDKDEVKTTTHPHVSTDPRLIHPALSLQVQQENKDKVIALKESLATVNTPVCNVIEVGPQSRAKLQNQIPAVEPPELKTMQEWNLEPTIETEPNTKTLAFNFRTDAFPISTKTDSVVTTKQKPPEWLEKLYMDLNKKDNPCNKNSKMTMVTNANPLVCGDLDQNRVQKKKDRGVKKIILTEFKQGSPAKMEEVHIDLNVGKNTDYLLPTTVNNLPTSKYINWDQTSLDPEQKIKQQAVENISPKIVEELSVNIDSNFLKDSTICANLDPIQNSKDDIFEKIIVHDFERRSPKMVEEAFDLDVKKNPGVLEGSVNSVNAPNYVIFDQSLDPAWKSEKRGVNEIIFADLKPKSLTKVEKISIPLAGKYVEYEPKSLNTQQKEEITVADFKQSAPTKIEEMGFDLNVKANLDFIQESNTGSVFKDLHKDEKRLADMDQDKLQELVSTEETVFDLKFKTSENTNQKVSEKIGKTGEPEQGHFQNSEGQCGIIENNILANVYARANRPKSHVSKTTLAQEPEESTTDEIPIIVIMPSVSEKSKELERVKNEMPSPKSFVQVANAGADTWEDESVDSDEHSSSESSQDSDLLKKRDQFSASTLSVTKHTASLLSVYSDAGDFGNVSVQGSVEFALMYSPLGELVIMVEQCQDLAIANPRKQRTDPYVKTYLYPDKRSKRKTSIKKRTVNPVYVESLRYKIKREELHGKTLNLSVWHNDSRGRNAFLGQVEINLKDWNWKQEALLWYNLQPKNVDNEELQEYPGVLCVSLKYVPSKSTGGLKPSQDIGEIHIWLREAKHLPRLKIQGVDSFVKCYMLPDTSKKSRQKTRVVKKTQNPVFNHNMVYDGLRAGEVQEACCELTVWDNNKMSNQFLGGVRLSLGTGQSYGKTVDWMDSENGEVEIWKKMMAYPNRWVEAELPLRSSMTPRKKY